jgi:hypothetical protein
VELEPNRLPNCQPVYEGRGPHSSLTCTQPAAPPTEFWKGITKDGGPHATRGQGEAAPRCMRRETRRQRKRRWRDGPTRGDGEFAQSEVGGPGAKALGKSLLLWCAQRSAVEKVLPDEMVAPELRTAEHLQDIVDRQLTGARRSERRCQAPEGTPDGQRPEERRADRRETAHG